MTIQTEKTYTLTDISQQLGRSRTTVFEWISLFREYIEPHTIGKGRTKRYKDTVIPVLSLIQQLKDEGNPNDYIRSLIGESGSPSIVEGEDASQAPFVMQLAEALQAIQTELEATRSQNEALVKALEASERRQVERDSLLIEEIRNLRVMTVTKTEEAEAAATTETTATEANRGFFSKLFGR